MLINFCFSDESFLIGHILNDNAINQHINTHLIYLMTALDHAKKSRMIQIVSMQRLTVSH